MVQITARAHRQTFGDPPHRHRRLRPPARRQSHLHWIPLGPSVLDSQLTGHDGRVLWARHVSISRTDHVSQKRERGQFLILSTPRPASSARTRDVSDNRSCPLPDARRSTQPLSSSPPARAPPKPPSLDPPWSEFARLSTCGP